MGKVLKKGAKGPQIKKMQDALNKAGARPKLNNDGVFGPATETAVKVYQKKKKMKADGLVGPKTMTALTAKPGARPKKPVEWSYGDAAWSLKDSAREMRELNEKHKKERAAMDLWKDDPQIAKLRELYDKNWKILLITDKNLQTATKKVAGFQKSYDRLKKSSPESLQDIVSAARKPFDQASKLDEKFSDCVRRRVEITRAYTKVSAKQLA